MPDTGTESADSTRSVTTATATYAAVNRAVAAGTVQSRTPSAIASASGPWPETESPTRCAIRHTAQAQITVMPSGIAEIVTPATVSPEPWPISQAYAPARSPSRGAPWAPASLRNQPATPTPRQTTRGPAAAATPPSSASSTSGRRWATSVGGSGAVRAGREAR